MGPRRNVLCTPSSLDLRRTNRDTLGVHRAGSKPARRVSLAPRRVACSLHDNSVLFYDKDLSLDTKR